MRQLLWEVRRYARAARLMVRHGPQPMSIARRAIHELGAVQRTWELASVVALVRSIRPQRIVEIGTYRGGTLFCWSRVAAEDAQLIMIDVPPDSLADDGIHVDIETFRRLIGPRQPLTWVQRLSQTPEAVAQTKQALAGHLVDWLWIDGDHSYAAVKRDFELYAPMVRPGGLIGFHDILFNPDLPETRVDLLWRELVPRYKSWAFIDQNQPGGVGMGIGIVQWPGA